jgi:hypothetical protein
VYFGGALGGAYDESQADVVLYGYPNDSAGCTLAVGDVQGDGYDDLAVGMCAEDVGQRGMVSIFDRDPLMDPLASGALDDPLVMDVTIHGSSGDYPGESMAFVGDLITSSDEPGVFVPALPGTRRGFDALTGGVS